MAAGGAVAVTESGVSSFQNVFCPYPLCSRGHLVVVTTDGASFQTRISSAFVAMFDDDDDHEDRSETTRPGAISVCLELDNVSSLSLVTVTAGRSLARVPAL